MIKGQNRTVSLSQVTFMHTGKLDSNAAVPNGEYPFFTCSQQTLRINKYDFDTEAVLLGGNNANGVFPLKYYKGQFNAYQRTYIIETKDKNVLNTRYLFYALKPALSHFQSASIGAATQYLTKGILDAFKINLPMIDTQQRIASILSAYDDLIENNRRRIQLLEQSARLLYKEWFVHFRFPGHEHVKINNGVPEGWERIELKEVIEYISRGITPKYDDDAESVVINQKCIRNRQLNLEFARKQSKTIASEKLIKYGDILINSTGKGTLGRVAQCLIEKENLTVDSHVSIVRIREGIDSLFIGQQIMEMEEKIETMGRGATNQTELSRDSIENLGILLPNETLYSEFGEFKKTIAEQIINLSDQNDKLQQARDILLPKLMNGEIIL